MIVPNQRKALLLGLCAVLLWATVATAFKIALQFLTPRQLVLIAALTSVIIFAGFISWQRQWRNTLLLAKTRTRFYLLLGLLNPFAYYWVLFIAYSQLPAQQAQAINYTWAITMSLLAVPILKQTLSKRELGAMLVAYAGVFLIATGGQWDFSQTNWLGISIALASTLLWASYWLINIRNTDAPVPALFWCFLWGSVWLLAAELLWPSPWQLDWRGLSAGIYVGIFEMGLTFLLWLLAMRQAEKTSQISMLIFLSPFLSLILIYAILGEVIHSTTIIGLSLICLGLYLSRNKGN
jgi:drug/metabolite transporter (DMT)-like permease